MKPRTITGPIVFTSLLTIGILVVWGCATFETNAYRTLGVTAHTVDIMMTTWADASVASNTTPQLDRQVEQAHAHYRQVMSLAQAAINGYRAGTNSQSAVNFALEAVTSSKEDLRKLILMLVLPQNQRNEIQKLP